MTFHKTDEHASKPPPGLRRSRTLVAGVIFSTILVVVVLAKILLPESPLSAMASELDRFRFRLLIERKVPIECKESRGPFLVEFQRLHIRVTEARLSNPPPPEIRALRRSMRALGKAASDNVLREDECKALSASLNNKPLPEIP